MAIVPIKKIAIHSTKKYKKDIVEFLHKSGLIQVIDMSDEGEVSYDNSSLEKDILDIEHVVGVLKEYHEEEKKSFVEKMSSGEKVVMTEDDFRSTIQSFSYRTVVDVAIGKEHEMQKHAEMIESLMQKKELLREWKHIGFSLEKKDTHKKWPLIFGKVSASVYASFVVALEEKIKRVSVETIQAVENTHYVLIVLPVSEINVLRESLLEYNFEEVQLPNIDKTPKQYIAEIEKEISGYKKQISQAKEDFKKDADEHLRSLMVMYDYLLWRKEKQEESEKFSTTKTSFTLSGWIQDPDISPLKNHLSEITSAFEITELEVDEDEKVPVVLHNASIIEPFESVTSVYGAPKPNEVDPTPFLAPFFILYFALCLTDAGYGLVLAIVSFLAIKIFKIPREKSKLFRLMIYAGITTFIVGALFGGWFGIESDKLPEFLKSIQIINPLNDVITVLALSAILGLIQIIVGIGIKVVWALKNKYFNKDVFLELSWMIFLLSGAFYIVFSNVVAVPLLAQAFLFVIYFLIALIVLLSGTDVFKKKVDGIKEKEGKSSTYYIWLVLGFIIGLPIRLISGVLGLYTIIGYVSDILSYSRLLALGLATGIIAMAINIIALLMVDLIPVVGYVFMVLLLIGGHLFNLAINVLGAYIHSGRLQFVEFFPKFIEGGGQSFIPMKREGKYVDLLAK